MSKLRRKVMAKVKAVEEAPKAEAVPATLKVKQGMKFRGAREAWYARLLEHDGKPVGEYLESCTKKPPHLTKAGTAENPKGWLSYFQRAGAVSLGK